MMHSAIEYDWFSRGALITPEAVALKEINAAEGVRTLNYGELNAAAARVAARLYAESGVRAGDRVAILAENSLEHVVLFGAAQKLGFALLPLNFRLAPAELNGVLSDAAPRLVLVEEKFRAALEAAPEAGSSVVMNIKDFFREEPAANALRNVPPSEAEYANVFDEHTKITPDSPLLLLYTSGATGVPKGVIYSHKMLFWNSVNTGMSWDLTAADRTVNCLPMFHTGGWNVLLTPLLHRGGMTTLMKKFDADAVLRLLERERCTLFMGVPTILQMLVSSPLFETADLSAMRYVVSGGEPMPLPLIETWQRRGIAVRQGYGMTEVGPNIFSLHHADAARKIGSIGRPNFYVHARLMDDNGKDITAPDEAGELLVRGPMVTPGYWKKPEATREAFCGDWFCTGDIARRDAEGYYYIVDRKKNMYISGGENVYPAEVERVLYTHEAVAEAAVIGVPDAQWGEVGKAFVVLKSPQNASNLDAEAIRRFCRERLAAYKVPKYVEFLEELPKNDAGKINRKILR
jgi:fatty-acyl-CoA synthase